MDSSVNYQSGCSADRESSAKTQSLQQLNNSKQQPDEETLLRNLVRYFEDQDTSEDGDSELPSDFHRFLFTLSPALESEVFLLKRKKETLDIHQRFSANPSESETQVLDRISVARKEARKVAAYTCITEYIFAEPRIDRHFCYERILSDAQNQGSPKKFVDVGCCVGSDIRKLIYDGFPAHVGESAHGLSAVTGLDIERRQYSNPLLQRHLIDFFGAEFFSIGLAMYNQSSENIPVRFVEANLLDPNFTTRHDNLRGQFDYVHSANVVHLFDYEGQMTFLRNLAFLAKPGGLLWGRQVGEAEDSPTRSLRIEGKGDRFTPNEFRQMWVDATCSQVAGWESRLVKYDELRLAQDYKKYSLEWVMNAPEQICVNSQRMTDLETGKAGT
ncbi:hypothetical protein FQN54_009355 [Arachnomyces sp. PD_36]|nr:hypothetical protein FQN54_009355 [Arachnomyces sp. PD_36]